MATNGKKSRKKKIIIFSILGAVLIVLAACVGLIGLGLIVRGRK